MDANGYDEKSVDYSQFPQTVEWTQWLFDAYWPSSDVWAIILPTV